MDPNFDSTYRMSPQASGRKVIDIENSGNSQSSYNPAQGSTSGIMPSNLAAPEVIDVESSDQVSELQPIERASQQAVQMMESTASRANMFALSTATPSSEEAMSSGLPETPLLAQTLVQLNFPSTAASMSLNHPAVGIGDLLAHVHPQSTASTSVESMQHVHAGFGLSAPRGTAHLGLGVAIEPVQKKLRLDDGAFNASPAALGRPGPYSVLVRQSRLAGTEMPTFGKPYPDQFEHDHSEASMTDIVDSAVGSFVSGKGENAVVPTGKPAQQGGLFDDAHEEDSAHKDGPIADTARSVSEQHKNVDEGIFDDADEGIELPQEFRATKTTEIRPFSEGHALKSTVLSSPERSKALGASDDIFGDADESQILAQSISSSDEKATAASPEAKPKKRKNLPALKKPVAAPSRKEKAIASAMLSGKTDLSRVLPEDASRFLAEKFWIFTLEQFDSVFDETRVLLSSNPKIGQLRQDIMRELATSALCQDIPRGTLQAAVEATRLKNGAINNKAMHDSVDLGVKDPGNALAESVDLHQPATETLQCIRENVAKSGDRINEHSTQNEKGDGVVASGVESAANAPETGNPTESLTTDETLTATFCLASDRERDDDAMAGLAQGALTKEKASETKRQNRSDKTEKNTIAHFIPSDSHCDQADVQSISRLNPEINAKRVEKAETLLESWKQRCAASKHDPWTDTKASFSLEGPFGVLIPQGIRNFLASVSVSSAHELISVRATESSPFVRALQLWRSQCGLQSLKRNILARQLTGIVTRVEKALTSVPPADSYTRKWMATPLACLTAASKDFLIDEYRVETPEEFVDGPTKSFADRLEAWRESRGMPPLKGSGKIAMVSSWKASMRDNIAAEIGTGRIIPEDDLIALSTTERSEDDDKPIKAIKPIKYRKPRSEIVPDQPDHSTNPPALHSAAFLEKALNRDQIAFLYNVGIRTPDQLLNADKREDSPVVIELNKYRALVSGKEPTIGASIRLLFEWAMKVKAELKLVDQAEEIPTKIRGRKRKFKSSVELSGSGSTEDQDMANSLSEMARSFLGSLHITTASDFLDARTTDIANALAKWREEKNMQPLKGSGGVATISSWKGSLRKKIAERQNRVRSVSVSTTTPLTKPAQSPPESFQIILESPRSQVVPLSHPGVLMGLPRRKFAVRSSTGPPCIYEFELSVRKSKSAGDIALYLCFLGARRDRLLSEAVDRALDLSGASTSKKGTETPSVSLLPVLASAETSDTFSETANENFATCRPGCGLVEISKYGAFPFPRDDEVKLRTKVKQFLLASRIDEEDGSLDIHAPVDGATTNVLVEESAEHGTRCFFFASEPLEKGQVTELRFSSILGTQLKTEVGQPFVAIVDRLALARTFSYLSLAGLSSVAQQLSSIWTGFDRDHEKTDVSDDSMELKRRVVRRRIHWLSSRIISALESREEARSTGGTLLTTSRHTVIEEATKLLMTEGEQRSLCLFFKQSGKVFVLEELSHEILCDAVLRGLLGPWHDKRRWCPLSIRVLKQVLRKASLLMIASSMGAVESQKEVLSGIESLVADAVKDILLHGADLIELAFGSMEPNDHHRYTCDPTIPRELFLNNFDALPMEALANLTQEEAYLNAMELCDEDAFGVEVRQALNANDSNRSLVAAKVPWRRGSNIIRWVDDVKNGAAELNETWYIEQILSIAHTIASSELLNWEDETTEVGTQPLYSYDRLANAARRAVETHSSMNPKPILSQDAHFRKDSELKIVRLSLSSARETKAAPTTLPLFLAVVWPRLRYYGWCIEMGDDPSDITFYPPGHKRRSERDNDRKRGQHRIERIRKRAKVEQRVIDAGLGEMPKITKRMFVSVTRDTLDPANGASVNHALNMFVSSVLAELPSGGDEESRRRIAAIEEAICACCDELLPMLMSTDGSESDNSSDGNSTDSAAYLMQVLLILPPLLEQSGLSTRQVEDTLGVIRDVANFVSANNGEIFDKPLKLSREEYKPGRETTRPFLSTRMKAISSSLASDIAGVDNPKDVGEIVLPEDFHNLTDYLGMTLSQMLPCRATAFDIVSKGRKNIVVGHPGMVCRHCRGADNDGKYFFASLDSLCTSPNAILPHMYRCKQAPEGLKAKLAAAKSRQADQLKRMPRGGQSSFFSRLWKRLHGSMEAPGLLFVPSNAHLKDDESAVDMTPQVKKETVDSAPDFEFKNHVDLLTYIDQTPPWNERTDLRQRLIQYYSCVSYGGELYMTNSMPSHFNAEWILGKIIPVERLSTKPARSARRPG